jgi:hypothetical protein
MSTPATTTPTKQRNRSSGPPSRGAVAARSALRTLGLAIVTRIDADDADLVTLARQAAATGRLALAELGAAAATD